MEPTIQQGISLTTVYTIGGFVVVGILAIIGFWDRTARRRSKDINSEATATEDRLLKLKEATIEQLTASNNLNLKEIAEMSKMLKEHEKNITKLMADNEFMAKLLQGRDEKTLDFQTKVLEAVSQTLALTTSMNQNFTALMTSLNQHFAKIEQKTATA